MSCSGCCAAWDRLEAHIAARKLAATAELIRRSPAPGSELAGPAGCRWSWDEFAADELAAALAESRAAPRTCWIWPRTCMPTARHHGRAPDGTISRHKADIIANATALLNEAEARAAEDEVLDRAARLTPGGLRAAIARAVMEVAPEKAKKRREAATKDARVERWTEDSGNAALMGRELPPDEVLAADQRITAWAMNCERRAGRRHGHAPRPRLPRPAARHGLPPPPRTTTGGRGRRRAGGLRGPGQRSRAPADPLPPVPAVGAVPAGFAGRVTLTAPLATLARLADRPGELAGLGPIDPWLARDLAAAAAQNPKTTWCVTVTDKHGHAIGHGAPDPNPRATPNAPAPARHRAAGFSFTPASRDGPPGGYGTWILRAPGDGPDLRVTLDPIDTGPCDHRFQAAGHDPGVKLRHLTQVRHATCTSPICRRPAAQCDFEHNTPYEAGGRTLFV